MLDEKGTVAALKEAYKNGGYRVAFAEGRVMIRAGVWGAEIEAEYICPKVLGTIVEHIGILPDDAAAYLAHKDADPGTTCSLDVELAAWAEIRRNADEAKTHIKRTQLIMTRRGRAGRLPALQTKKAPGGGNRPRRVKSKAKILTPPL